MEFDTCKKFSVFTYMHDVIFRKEIVRQREISSFAIEYLLDCLSLNRPIHKCFIHIESLFSLFYYFYKEATLHAVAHVPNENTTLSAVTDRIYYSHSGSSFYTDLYTSRKIDGNLFWNFHNLQY